jgi:polyhydroxybutyrate depolymerase
MSTVLFLAAMLAVAEPLSPGEHARTVTVGPVERSYLVHVPRKYDPAAPVPVVLCFHGAFTTGRMQRDYSGMNRKADEAGFVAVYPDGTGHGKFALTWNAGNIPSHLPDDRRDDVEFTRKLLDDLATVVNVDPKRVFACGMSNGGMMSHRLAIELSDRIAAVAAVAGTLSMPNPHPQRAVSVLQIHGTEDTAVPWFGKKWFYGKFTVYRSVDETVDFWVKHNHCRKPPQHETLPDRNPRDETTVERFTYAGGTDGTEVVLVKITGGGHTWPGDGIDLPYVLGRMSHDVVANDLIWEFFERNPMK